MDLKEIKKEIENHKAVLLDVREKKEWDEDHLIYAHLCPLSEIKKGNSTLELPKDKMIYIHCRSGGRAKAAEELLKKDYQVKALGISFDELKRLGF